MFVQVIQGETTDRAEVRRMLDRWVEELSAGAEGWLGSTGGVTDDGTFVGVTRFASEEAARRNSDRPEQGQWWSEAAKVFTGPVEFHDCVEVHVNGGGGSDDAGFVQVIQARSADPDRSRALLREWEEVDMSAFRPDLLGSLIAMHEDGERATQVVWFRSEAEAREGERAPLPPEFRERSEEAMSLMRDVRFFDLRDPWLLSPR